MNSLKTLLFFIAATSLCVASASSGSPRDEEIKKARYYYLQGIKAFAANDASASYEYFKKAYEIYPANDEAAFHYGLLRFSLPDDTMATSSEMRRSFSLMSPYVRKHPADNFRNPFYAFAAMKVDSMPLAVDVYENLVEALPEKTDNLISLADVYMRSGRAADAVATLSKYEVAEGFSPQLTLRKASYRLSAGDTVGALADADALMASNPKDASYIVLKGNVYDYIGKRDSAYVEYARAESLDPEFGGAKLALANYYKQEGDSMNYDAKIYEALLSEDFNFEQKTSLLADYLQNLISDKSDTSRGDTLFNVLHDQYPHEPQLLYLSSRYSAAKGDYKKAVEEIGYALDLDAENPEFWHSLVRYHILDDEPTQGMAAYHKSKSHIDTDSEFKLMYAACAQMADSIDTAVEIYTGLIHELVPQFPVRGRITDKSPARALDYYSIAALAQYYEMLGDALYSHFKKNPSDTIYLQHTYDAYDNSLDFIDNNPTTLNNYAYFLAENGGDLQRAKEMSARSISTVESSTNLDTYAWILFHLGEYKEARDYQTLALEKAREDGGISAELYSHYGDILFMNGEPEKALEYWEKALELDPDDDLLKKKVEHRTFFYK